MHLRHLTLQGYKSFADKTEFEFPSGVTAIVGPNGTGKSNIADAIRWALGERSMSVLRAKSSADMIFAGGQGRARAGMAEVSLTFDNSDGGLPIEFSEVTISRRAYRSGENEYMINGSQVLLRDIEELLAESSLSERTYTVIGQGLVDAALALRPRERRALFEEAAGLTLYRDRREKTVERLDETGRNLERVHDIIGEVSPRLERLERDARQVEQHRRLTAHLNRLQWTWYGYQWGQKQAELGRSLDRASNLVDRLEARRRKASGLDKRLTQVREREGLLRRKLRDWYRASADLHDKVDEARRELAVSEERERLLQRRREELLAEIEPLEVQREEQAQQVAELGGRVEELEDDLTSHRQRLSEMEQEASTREHRAARLDRERAQLERELRSHRSRLERLDQRLQEARKEISGLASKQAVAEERARVFESRREEAMAELKPLRTEEEEQRERVAQYRARLEELETRLTRPRAELAEAEAEFEAYREQAAEPDQEWSRVIEALLEHRAELERMDRDTTRIRETEAELAGELKALDRMHTTGAAYGKGVHMLLEADLDGVVGLLAGLIRVPSLWERAVSAALGSDLLALVVETMGIAEEAQRILETESGRVTLVPLTGCERGERADPMPLGALSAAEVVSCDKRIQPVVDAVLGPVALCDDLTEARTLLPELPPGSCCATRSGIVLRADGMVVVGSPGVGGVLANQRARRELRRRRQTMRARCQEIELRRDGQALEVASLERRLEEIDRQAAQAKEMRTQRLQEQVGQARTAVALARETIRSQRAALQREESVLERFRSQCETLQREAAELETQHAKALRLAVSQIERGEQTLAISTSEVAEVTESFRARLREANRLARELEDEQRKESERVSALQERLERLARQAADARENAAQFERRALSRARTALALAEASLRREREALERESAQLERLRSQVEARRERAGELKAERGTLLDRVGSLRERASRLETDLEAIREPIGPAEDELENLGADQRRLEERRERAQKQVRTAEDRYGRAELAVERRRDGLHMLAQRIDEDLGLVELELADSVTAQAPLPMRPLVSELPVVEQLPGGLRDEMKFVKKRLRRLGSVNPNAPNDLAEVQKRHSFLSEQAADLEAATAQLRRSVSELDRLMERAFGETFHAVAGEFSRMFAHLFQGGEARVELTDPDDLLNTGVEIVARPPGKRAQRLALLSGGERALTATALLFSLLQVSSTPFCVFDEVDAMLDEANVGRFRAQLKELSRETQFIVITHNRVTVESAHTVYGVSMGSNAVSQVVSLRLDGVQQGEPGVPKAGEGTSKRQLSFAG